MSCGIIHSYHEYMRDMLSNLLGLAIVGLGIAALTSLHEVNDILPVQSIPIFLIVLGAIVFFIGFLACCGAARESRCMLIFYAIIVALILAGFIYLTVIILGSLDTLTQTVDRWIFDAFNARSLQEAFYILETTFLCCGHAGAESYIAIGEAVPPTCCPEPTSEGTCITDTYRGCGVLVGNWLETFSTVIGTVLIVIIIIQSVALIFALFLSNSIRNARKEAKRVY